MPKTLVFCLLFWVELLPSGPVVKPFINPPAYCVTDPANFPAPSTANTGSTPFTALATLIKTLAKPNAPFASH